jgi:natural product precursor
MKKLKLQQMKMPSAIVLQDREMKNIFGGSGWDGSGSDLCYWCCTVNQAGTCSSGLRGTCYHSGDCWEMAEDYCSSDHGIKITGTC